MGVGCRKNPLGCFQDVTEFWWGLQTSQDSFAAVDAQPVTLPETTPPKNTMAGHRPGTRTQPKLV